MNCSDGLLPLLERFLKKKSARAMAISTTTAEPMAMPAMAPPLSLLEDESMDLSAGRLVEAGAEVEAGFVEVGGEVDDGGAAVELAPADPLAE